MSYSKEFLISYMRDKTKELGRIPKILDFKSPSYRTYYKCFGSFSKALFAAGVIDEKEYNKRNAAKEEYSEEVLIDCLKQRILELGRIPYTYEILNPSLKHYIKAFGNYKKSVEKTGVNKNQLNLNSEDMIQYLRDLYVELGRVPFAKELIKYNKHLYVRYFDSWDKALKIANIEKPNLERKYFKREELIALFMKLYNDIARVPKYSELKSPSLAEYLLEFGTYEELLKACNIEYDMWTLDKGRTVQSKDYDKIFEYMKLHNVSLEDIRVLLGYEKANDVMGRLERRGFSNINLDKLKEYLEITSKNGMPNIRG